MTLTINPSTSIRPLGEEHLRMFRRTVGQTENGPPKISLPKEAGNFNLPKPVSMAKGLFKGKVVQDLSWSDGNRLATYLDALMDKEFLEGHQNFVVWVDSEEIPYQAGLYKIDREVRQLRHVAEFHEWLALPWVDKVRIDESEITATNQGRPLVLRIMRDPVIQVSGMSDYKHKAQMALVHRETDFEDISPLQKFVLLLRNSLPIL